MTVPAGIEPGTVTEAIEDLDFPIPCGHSQHETRHIAEEPAAYIVETLVTCGCKEVARYPLCATWWARMTFVYCGDCRMTLPRDEQLRIVEVLP